MTVEQFFMDMMAVVAGGLILGLFAISVLVVADQIKPLLKRIFGW